MLSAPRTLNLAYYRIVSRLSSEDREKFDNLMVQMERSPAPAGTPRGKQPPSWWKGDGAAAQSSIAAARELGFAVGSAG